MNKRTLSLASVALLTLSLLPAGTVSATPPAGPVQAAANCVAPTPTPTPTATPTPTPTATPSPTPTPTKVASFGAKVTPGHPCGTIHVQAKVKHPARGTTFSASATAHFSTGDITVALRRAGSSFVAIGKIFVPEAQPAGNVNVDITLTYGGVAQPVITRVSRIRTP